MNTQGTKNRFDMVESYPTFPFTDEAPQDIFTLAIDDPIPFDEILALLEQASSLCDDMGMLEEPKEDVLNQVPSPQTKDVQKEKPTNERS